MISKKNKFPLRTEFLRFRAHANKVVTPHLTVYSAPSDHSRLAVIVPAKVSKLATTRNFLKRLTYDTLFPTIKDCHLDCVVVYKPLVLSRSPQTKATIIFELKSVHV